MANLRLLSLWKNYQVLQKKLLLMSSRPRELRAALISLAFVFAIILLKDEDEIAHEIPATNETPTSDKIVATDETPGSGGAPSSNISSRSSNEKLLNLIRRLQSKFSSSKTARIGKSTNLTYSPKFEEIKKKG